MAGSPRILLASGSPRRRDLLAGAGLEFAVEPSDADEAPPPGAGAEEIACALAERKAREVAARHAGEDLLVVGADTVVALAGGERERLLGKPANAGEARAMLRALSGSRHRVVTGVAVVRSRDGRCRAGFERTWVTMRAIAPEEVEAYVESGEWRDKAGGYAIQETADAFVTGLEEGGLDNVVGLPVRLTLELLRAAGGRG